jgi:hypothetical protein
MAKGKPVRRCFACLKEERAARGIFWDTRRDPHRCKNGEHLLGRPKDHYISPRTGRKRCRKCREDRYREYIAARATMRESVHD